MEGCGRYVLLLLLLFGVLHTQGGDGGAWACQRGVLETGHARTPSVSLREAVLLQLRPRDALKTVRLKLLLEDEDGAAVYEASMDAELGRVGGDLQVAVRDARTYASLLKVSWPPIVFPHAWSSLHLRLHYHHLLQVALLPGQALQQPRSYSAYQTQLRPLAVSVLLERSSVRKLSLQLLTANTSLQYALNCGQEYVGTFFAADFGLATSEGFWRDVSCGLGVVVGVLGVAAGLLALTVYRLACKSPRGSRGRPTIQEPGGNTDASLHPPRVTLGKVSSRAPSPGHELDENTIDYVNIAFTPEDG